MDPDHHRKVCTFLVVRTQMRGSVVHDLVRLPAISAQRHRRRELRRSLFQRDRAHGRTTGAFRSAAYSMSFLIVAAARGRRTGRALFFGIENVDLVFITAVVSVAVRFGLWPRAATSAASLCYISSSCPDLHFHDHRTDQRRGVLLLHADLRCGLQCRGRCAPSRVPIGGCGPRNRFMPSAASLRDSDAGRCVVGRLSGGADAHGTGVLLLPRRRPHREDRLPPEDELDNADLAAANWAWGNAARRARPDTLPGASACSADANRTRANRRHRHPTTTERAAC